MVPTPFSFLHVIHAEADQSVDTEDIRALLALMRENSFAPLLAHAPYTLNACSADSKIRDFARMVMTEDLRCWSCCLVQDIISILAVM